MDFQIQPASDKKNAHAHFRGRLHVEEVADLLGFQAHDIPILVASKLLKPLGSPAPNAPKYFASIQILELAQDVEWLDKASKVMSKHWKMKNDRQKAIKSASSLTRISKVD
jgi:hypothetical protein